MKLVQKDRNNKALIFENESCAVIYICMCVTEHNLYLHKNQPLIAETHLTYDYKYI